MSYYGFRPYVPVAKRRQQAAHEIEKLKKKGRDIAPVKVEGRKIAQSFWGEAWCDNLERYSDFENRLPRGRTYIRNGSVLDLKISRGSVSALVSGSEIYEVKVQIAVAAPHRWKSICKDCAGSIGSLVELLQGKLSKNVMERVCREGDGLFPSPSEIKMSCSCHDWADMCKHAAAALYGVGARFDAAPDLLFALRGVDRAELISTASADLPLTQTQTANERRLDDDDVAALFGIEMTPELPPRVADASAMAPSKGATTGHAEKSTAGRVKKPSPHAGQREPQSPADKDPEAKKARGSPATVASRREKPAAKREGSAATSNPRTQAKGAPRASSKAKAQAAAKTPTTKPTSNFRHLGEAPVGRTRAAKWIGARARKSRG